MASPAADVDDWFVVPTPAPTILHRFVLYETPTRFYLVGECVSGGLYRVLKIHRGIDSPCVEEVEGVYNQIQLHGLLGMIASGNGTMKERCRFCALLGFVRFLYCHYMVVVTHTKLVGNIGANGIHAVDEVEMVAIAPGDYEKDKAFRKIKAQELRYRHTFMLTDLTRDFFFSHSYDLSRSVQTQVLEKRAKLHATVPPEFKWYSTSQADLPTPSNSPPGSPDPSSRRRSRTGSVPPNIPLPPTPNNEWRAKIRDMFLWNGFLRESFFREGGAERWVVRLVHGFFAQRLIGVFGRGLRLTLLARRSCRFAGTRFLKRGVNAEGHVANDVEVEQILAGDFAVDPSGSCGITSYTQMRGSVPVFWGQDTSMLDPKPEIDIHGYDLAYTATLHHFREMIARYGAPVVAMNLVKKVERRPRETKLGEEFSQAMDSVFHDLALHTNLPRTPPEPTPAPSAPSVPNNDQPPRVSPGDVLRYVHWDFSLVAKNKDRNVVAELNAVLLPVVDRVKFFSTRGDKTTGQDMLFQTGVLRVNCIDCLDRTNVAQLCMAKLVLGHQVHALGVSGDTFLPGNSLVVEILIQLYEQLGDALSMQYGGSEAVKSGKLDKIKKHLDGANDSSKTNSGTVLGKILTNAHRFYSNVMTDAEKQASMNLLLGMYIPHPPHLASVAIPTHRPRLVASASQRKQSGSAISSIREAISHMNELQAHQRQCKREGEGADCAELEFRVWQDMTPDEMDQFEAILHPSLWDFENDYHLHNQEGAKQDALWMAHRRTHRVVQDIVHTIQELHHLRSLRIDDAAAVCALAQGSDAPLVEVQQGGPQPQRPPQAADHALAQPQEEDEAATMRQQLRVLRAARQSQSNSLKHAKSGITVFDDALGVMSNRLMDDCLRPVARRFAKPAEADEEAEPDMDGDDKESEAKFKRWFVFSKSKIGQQSMDVPPTRPNAPSALGSGKARAGKAVGNDEPRRSRLSTLGPLGGVSLPCVAPHDQVMYGHYVALGEGPTLLMDAERENMDDLQWGDSVSEQRAKDHARYLDVERLCHFSAEGKAKRRLRSKAVLAVPPPRPEPRSSGRGGGGLNFVASLSPPTRKPRKTLPRSAPGNDLAPEQDASPPPGEGIVGRALSQPAPAYRKIAGNPVVQSAPELPVAAAAMSSPAPSPVPSPSPSAATAPSSPVVGRFQPHPPPFPPPPELVAANAPRLWAFFRRQTPKSESVEPVALPDALADEQGDDSSDEDMGLEQELLPPNQVRFPIEVIRGYESTCAVLERNQRLVDGADSLIDPNDEALYANGWRVSEELGA